MKQLHNILNQYSRPFGQEPAGAVYLDFSKVFDKRCLYTWVS